MASLSLSCPRCGGSMEQGFIIDETHGTMKSQKWVGGAPEYSFWFGLKLRATLLTLVLPNCSSSTALLPCRN